MPLQTMTAHLGLCLKPPSTPALYRARRGLAPDDQWKPCKPRFFLPVRVFSRLFRRLCLEQLVVLHPRLGFYGEMDHLIDARAFRAYLDSVCKIDWVIYDKRPFSGPKAVLECLSRYTHRITISNSRILNYDQHTVTFKWKDYQVKGRRKFRP